MLELVLVAREISPFFFVAWTPIRFAGGQWGEDLRSGHPPVAVRVVAKGGAMSWLGNSDSMKNRDEEDESPLKRLSQVLASNNGVEEADPEEVEARLRNMSHGTNSE